MNNLLALLAITLSIAALPFIIGSFRRQLSLKLNVAACVTYSLTLVVVLVNLIIEPSRFVAAQWLGIVFLWMLTLCAKVIECSLQSHREQRALESPKLPELPRAVY